MGNSIKIVTVVGARPQFIKAAPVSKALRSAGHTEYLVHTGQHYDQNMSQIFFDELQIPAPDCNLAIGSASHGRQTGEMLMHLEEVLLAQQPDWVLVYGDTNSTLAGALAAAKLQIPVAHVEAGLRSFNRAMPEEHNRVLTDHCADLLFCPTQTAVDLLAKEGITQGVHLVGDTMYDAVLQFSQVAQQKSTVLDLLQLAPQDYYLATVHRPYNTDVPENLENILWAFAALDKPVIFPVHPRTRGKIKALAPEADQSSTSNLRFIEPVGYLDMLMLLRHAATLLTDSGGMQKEAYFFAVPCVTLRPETEWVETVAAGWNVLVGADREKIVESINTHRRPEGEPAPAFGDGHAAEKIVELLYSGFKNRHQPI
ncbi:MAG: UDP-N-acetylglucosamine 2-epimerase (non-hydrolyzing) [Caldilineaceae bacterium]